MAILNGSYKFHTSPTQYATIDENVIFVDNEGSKYTHIVTSPGFYTTIVTEAYEWIDVFSTIQPMMKGTYSTTTFDDIENAPWLVLTFDNQEVSDLLYEIITNCADPYFDGILVNITSPEGVTLATEKTIVNSNIKVTIDESLLNQGTDTSDATATSDEIFAGKTAYIADGKVDGTFTIENELSEQDELISQIETLVRTKASIPDSIKLEIKNASVTDSILYISTK